MIWVSQVLTVEVLERKRMNRSSRCVRIYNQRGPIGGRGCIEQANRKQLAMQIFVAQGDKNILNKIASWAAYLTFFTSVFFSWIYSTMYGTQIFRTREVIRIFR